MISTHAPGTGMHRDRSGTASQAGWMIRTRLASHATDINIGIHGNGLTL